MEQIVLILKKKNIQKILLNKKTFKLPLYNVKKLLYKRNENYLAEKTNDDLKTNNINYKDKSKDNFPFISKNNFDSTDINLFRRNCLNKRRKINKKMIKIKIFDKNYYNNKKKLNYCLSYGKQFFNNKELIQSSSIKMNTEINNIKNKVKQLYNRNNTSDNMALSNDY